MKRRERCGGNRSVWSLEDEKLTSGREYSTGDGSLQVVTGSELKEDRITTENMQCYRAAYMYTVASVSKNV